MGEEVSSGRRGRASAPKRVVPVRAFSQGRNLSASFFLPIAVPSYLIKYRKGERLSISTVRRYQEDTNAPPVS